jgi:hypothetical protein
VIFFYLSFSSHNASADNLYSPLSKANTTREEAMAQALVDEEQSAFCVDSRGLIWSGFFALDFSP